MATDKYATRVAPNLEVIEQWVAAGVEEKTIAAQLGVAYSTFRKYLSLGRKGDQRYGALAEMFDRARLAPIEAVESALFRRACGFITEDVKREVVIINGKERGVVKVTTRRREIPPDPTAAKFWLMNNAPERWRMAPAPDESEAGRGVVLLPPVGELVEPEEVSMEVD